MSSEAQAAAPPGVQADPRRWLVLVIMLIAGFMNLLDVTIVNIAVPSIQRSLSASYADVQWALAGYTLAYALVLITGGRLGDIAGRKRMFLAGVAGFTILSALCAAAQSPGQLIAARVVQGAMAAVMIPQILSMIQVSFPAKERIKALAAYGVTAGLGTVSGPLLGGLLTEHDILGLGWRSIFMINLPVGVLAFAASAKLVRESRAEQRSHLDLAGLALVTLGLLLLLYPLVEGRQLGWPTWSFVAMGASAPVFGLFVTWERAKTRRDGSPLVQLRLFAHRSFVVGMAIAVTFFLGVASFSLVMTLFLQLGLGFAPLHAGLNFLPFSGGVLVASGLAARLAPRFGRGVTITGAVVMASGMAALIGIVHHYSVAVTTWQMVPALAVAGLGMGAVLAPLADILLAGVDKQDAGSASGILNTGFQLGSSVGIALIGVIFFGFLGTQARPAAAAVAPQVRAALAAAHVPAADSARITTEFGACLHDRLTGTDPTVTPASCRLGPSSARLAPVLTSTGISAVRHDFAASLVRTLWYQVGVFLLSALLMLALPRRDRGRDRQADATASSVTPVTQRIGST